MAQQRLEHLAEVRPGGRKPDWMNARHHHFLIAMANQVRRRTSARCWIDLRRAQLVFGYLRRDSRIALIGLPNLHLYRGGNKTDVPSAFGALDVMNVNDICDCIQLAKVDPAKKDRWERTHEMRLAHERTERYGEMRETARPLLRELMEYHRRRMHGTQKTVVCVAAPRKAP